MNAITRNSIVKLYTFFFIILLTISCNKNHESFAEEITVENVDLLDDYDAVESTTSTVDEEDEKSYQLQHTSSVSSNIPDNLKIIKTASTRYKVESIDKALRDIKQIMFVNGGYISELRYDKNHREKQSRFTIKIPKENFDTMLDGLQKSAKETDYVNISTTDVTEKYLDAQSRLQTKMEVKARLEAVLRKNAKSVKDILATENQLRVIQEEIEAAQGRIKYMSSKVAYSTIQVEIYETVTFKEAPEAYEKGFGAKALEGLSAGWEAIQGIAIVLLYIWPILLLAVIGLFTYKRWSKRKRS